MSQENPELDAILGDGTKFISTKEPLKARAVSSKKQTKRVREKQAQEAIDLTVNNINQKTLKRVTPEAKADAFKHFEEAVGGRFELREVLAHCPVTSPAYKGLSKLLKDEDFNLCRDVALDVICDRNKVHLGTLLLAFKEAKIAQFTVQTITRLAEHVPDVVDSTALDAKNTFQACPVCAGTTRIPRTDDTGEYVIDENGDIVTQLCYNCKNTPGRVFQRHDAQSRKMFFQLTGLIRPEGKPGQDAPVVQIANITGNFIPGDGSYEHLIKAIDKVAIPSRVTTEEDMEVPFALYDTDPKGSEVAHNPTDPASE